LTQCAINIAQSTLAGNQSFVKYKYPYHGVYLSINGHA
jgi:hypothetical protein